MNIYIVRHAIAEDFPSSGGGDEARALTREGKKKMAEAAAGFAKLDPEIDAIFSSPLVRAKQTAEIVAAALNKQKVEIMNELSPGFPPHEVCSRLRKLRENRNIALVGHEPNCSELSAYLMQKAGAPNLEFKKGAICLIESADCTEGSGFLVYHLPPKVLRLI